jgi:hypothetical protein
VDQSAQSVPTHESITTQATDTEQDERRVGLVLGASFMIPILLDGVQDPDASVSDSVGLGVMGRLGWELSRGFVIDVNAGFHINDLYRVDTLTGESSDGSLTHVFVGTGIRYGFHNATRWVPFVGAGLHLHFRTTMSEEVAEDMALGLNGVAGIAFDLGWMSLELGARVDGSVGLVDFSSSSLTTLSGEVVELGLLDPTFILSPVAGATFAW